MTQLALLANDTPVPRCETKSDAKTEAMAAKIKTRPSRLSCIKFMQIKLN